MQVVLEKPNIIITGTVDVGVLWELHINAAQITKGKVESTCLGLLTGVLVDDKLYCSYVLDFTHRPMHEEEA